MSNLVHQHNTREINTQECAQYVLITKEILLHPPICSARKFQEGCLTPFEFAIAAAILRLGRKAQSEIEHDKAFESGRIAIDKKDARRTEIERDIAFKKSWVRTDNWARDEEGTRVEMPDFDKTVDTAISKAGRNRYRTKREQLREKRSDLATVETSAYQLLKIGQITNRGSTNKGVADAIERLQQEIVVNGSAYEPLIRNIKKNGNQFLLELDLHWSAASFAKVPLPLPMRSHVALSLLIFLEGIITSEKNKKAISSAELCRRIGLPDDLPNSQFERRVRAALDIVNAQREGCKPRRYFKPYEIEILNKGKAVRFFIVKRKIKRVYVIGWSLPYTQNSGFGSEQW